MESLTGPAASVVKIAEPPQARQFTRLLDIERMKGFGILLVVYGHLVMHGTLGEQPWYNLTKAAVYFFHMPLFMYLSGYVFYYTGAHSAPLGKVVRKIGSRADRLLVPFLAISFLVVALKSVASSLVALDDGVSGVWSGVWAVLSNSPNNPSIMVWYLLVLFIYSIVTPFLYRVFAGRLLLLLGVAFAMHFIPATERFYIARILHYFVFFIAGLTVCRFSRQLLPVFEKYVLLFLGVFLAALVAGRLIPFTLLVCGLLSIPAIHGLFRQKFMGCDRFFLWIGASSMVIYLFNTLAIGAVKAIYVKALPYDGAWFTVLIVTLMAGGTFIPMALKALLHRVPRTARISRYLE